MKKKLLASAAGLALAAGMVMGGAAAAQAASWFGPFTDSAYCQAERRIFMQEGYNVGPCVHRPNLPGTWFSYS
jgi:ABC-type sugar transport system substrate-binding protein